MVGKFHHCFMDVNTAFEFIYNIVVVGCEKFIPRHSVKEGDKKHRSLPKSVLGAISIKN